MSALPATPSLAECVAAGTHMMGCTADGACKICYEYVPVLELVKVTEDKPVKPVKVELRRFTTNRRLSQETTAFAADVWVDGKKAGYAENDGHGGNTSVHLDPAVRDAVKAYGKTLIPPEYKSFTNGAEWIVDGLVEAELKRRDEAAFAKRIAKADAKEKIEAAKRGLLAARYRQGGTWRWFHIRAGLDPRKAADALGVKFKVAVDEVVVIS